MVLCEFVCLLCALVSPLLHSQRMKKEKDGSMMLKEKKASSCKGDIFGFQFDLARGVVPLDGLLFFLLCVWVTPSDCHQYDFIILQFLCSDYLFSAFS